MLTLRILIGYSLQNIACLVNIYRWELILKAANALKNGLTINEDSNESQIPFYRRKIAIVNIIVFLVTFSMYIVCLLDIPESELLFFLFQGLTINMLTLTLSYVRIYQYFKAYNIRLLEKYQQIYLKEDKTKILLTIQEVKFFFSYIIIVLMVQSIFMFWWIFASRSGEIDLEWNDRINDILVVLLLMSYILMNLGISRSIKKSFKVQLRQK
jgi:hypothetical protein